MADRAHLETIARDLTGIHRRAAGYRYSPVSVGDTFARTCPREAVMRKFIRLPNETGLRRRDTIHRRVKLMRQSSDFGDSFTALIFSLSHSGSVSASRIKSSISPLISSIFLPRDLASSKAFSISGLARNDNTGSTSAFKARINRAWSSSVCKRTVDRSSKACDAFKFGGISSYRGIRYLFPSATLLRRICVARVKIGPTVASTAMPMLQRRRMASPRERILFLKLQSSSASNSAGDIIIGMRWSFSSPSGFFLGAMSMPSHELNNLHNLSLANVLGKG